MPDARRHLPTLALVCTLLRPGPGEAHQDPNANVPSVRALKVEAELLVDGVLDESFWAEAEVGGGLRDVRTGETAADPTTFRVAYTRRHLYLAVECFDVAMTEIHATEQREDRSFTGDDWVEVHLDPPHTHRSKYAFFSNPLGTRSDANEGPSGMFNYGWSAEWDLAARLETNRWVFEMRIPLAALNCERRDNQTWGFNLTRQVRRNDTLSFWSFSRTDMYKPRHFGHITGLDLADTEFDRNWEVTPYASVRADFDGDQDTFFQAGVDVSTRLSPAITAALTVNPDFGQVEADADTIELRDTERFLPERRPFFREGDELIRMPYRMYYSRRFNEIDAGLNVSGLWHGMGFSALNVQGEVARDDGYYGNSTVLRLLQNVGERSSLGYYGGASILEDGHAAAGSVDGYLFLSDDWRVSLQAALADEELNENSSQDYLGYGALVYEHYPWSFNAGYHAVTDSFDPLLGYVPRRDIFGPSLFGQWYSRENLQLFKEARISYETQYFENGEQETSLRDHRVSGYLLMPSDVSLRLGQAYEYHAPYRNHRTSAGMTIFATDLWRSFSIGWAGGKFEDIRYNEFSVAKPLKFWERFPIQWEFVIRPEDHPDGDSELPWLNRIVFDLYLARAMWVKGSLQHRNAQIHNVSLIYGWEFRPRTWWYLVFNSVQNPEDPNEGNSIFTKLTYTF